MRLLIVTQAVDTEDSALGFFHRWIEEFASHCESVHVICLKEGAHALPKNVYVHTLGKERGRSRVKYVTRFFRYIAALSGQYDAVFVHMNPEYVVLGGWYWRLMRKPVALWYVHRAKRWWLRVAARVANVLITSAPESFRVANEKLLVVGHAVDVESFDAVTDRPVNPQSVRMVSLGRITKIKNLDVIVRAIALLNQRGIRATLDLVGEPVMKPDFAYVESVIVLARELGVSEDVRFTGPVAHRDIPAVLSKYDVSVNAAPTGGIDKTVLESAMAGAVPLMANTAFRRFFAEDSRDLLFDGSPENLADRILAIVSRSDIDALRTRLRAQVADSSDVRVLVPRILKALS